MAVIDWLLDADPSIRWQAMRDLTHGPADGVAAERAKVATEGWGARLSKVGNRVPPAGVTGPVNGPPQRRPRRCPSPALPATLAS